MERLKVQTIDGEVEEIVYTVKDFPYKDLIFNPLVKKGKRVQYYNCSSAFDIETTTVDGLKDFKGNYEKKPYGFMYQWQFCINEKVIFGRTWEEFTELLKKLVYFMDLNINKRLVIYVHLLAFEFQFIKEFIDIESVFAKDKRKPMKVVCKNGIEFRCSYFLSNMSLAKFCENTQNCKYYKLLDVYDYSKLRTKDTVLSDIEKSYCYNDVRGLCECIDNLLLDDTVASIPLTNTGYVRRDYRKAMDSKEDRKVFLNSQLEEDEYLMLRKAFRGGNTHANRYKVNKVVNNVYSFDIASSYPTCIMEDYVPIGRFMKVRLNNLEKLNYYCRNFCVVMEVTFKSIKAKKGNVIPYIDLAHCTYIKKDKEKKTYINDNGRILSADLITLNLTEIDFEIIVNTYDFESLAVTKSMYAIRGKLPFSMRQKMMEYYEKKTQLKDVEGKEYEYMKSKNRLNSTFGMCVTRIDNSDIIYNSDSFEWEETLPIIEDSLKSFYKSRNSFLAYQWGVYITAQARKRLQKMINKVGEDVVYCDTDSIKFINSFHVAEFENENKLLREKALKNDIKAVAYREGFEYPLGVWDNDGFYTAFKTLGAKKYCFEKIKDDKKIFNVTVSGMNKKKGASAVGSCDNFQIGKTYTDIGRTTSWYNDELPHSITVDGVTFTTASNIGVLDTTYTLGVTNEYWELLEWCENE